MLNHIHGILVLANDVEAGLRPAPTATRRHALPEIVRAFKAFSTRRINEYRSSPGAPFWQRNYYEHVIRDEASMNRIREYIVMNPLRWSYDRDNPERIPDQDEDSFWEGLGLKV
jgi:REP element-mobilizing transposase RayT